MRRYTAYILFYIGVLCNKVDWYMGYSRFMSWSSKVQGPSENGPWSNAEEEE